MQAAGHISSQVGRLNERCFSYQASCFSHLSEKTLKHPAVKRHIASLCVFQAFRRTMALSRGDVDEAVLFAKVAETNVSLTF